MQRLPKLQRCLLLRPLYQGQLTKVSCVQGMLASSSSSSVPPTPAEAQKAFWAKNAKLNRPLSPWMIYKPQITSVLSISHRITGLGLSVLMYAWGIQACLSATNWAATLESLANTFPHWMLYTLKVLVATSLGYHLINGVRHLFWDMGYGFKLKHLYSSGYFTVGLTLIIALIAMANA